MHLKDANELLDNFYLPFESGWKRWPFGFDMDVPLATKSRMAFLDRAAADKTLVGNYHLPFPGFGHVVREGSGYRWLPADWQWTS